MMISGPLKLNSPGISGAHNRASSVWMWSAQDFDLAWQRAKWGRFWARLTLRAKPLPVLEARASTHHHRTDLGLCVVATKAIVGSVGRSADFDHNFTPLHKHIAQRWISINRAHYLGSPLPPIELIEVNGRYFVHDGHHRVSVARWHGQAYLEAHVVRLEMDTEMHTETGIEPSGETP